MGLHFLAFWPCGLPFILALSGSASGVPPQVAKNCPFAQRPYNGFISAVTGSILQFLAFWAFISLHFGLVGLHFLVFWPCWPSFPCILALWAFISLHFGFVGLHFLSFWRFRGQLLGPPPQVAKNGLFAQRPYNQWIYQRRDRLHFAVFSLLGLHFLAFWPLGPSFPCILALRVFISLHFGIVGFHFLAFWPCGPSFPCILALWAFISLRFGLFGVSFWGPPPHVAKNCPFAQRPYNGFISAVTGSILQFLAFWAFISLHFGRAGFHFLSFPVKPLPSANDPCLKYDFLLAHLPGMGFLPVKPLPSANDPYLKWDFLMAHLAGIGVFPGKPLPPANDPCLKWDFLRVPLPGMDFLPVKPLPSANDPCLKWEFWLARTWDFCLRPCGRGLLPGERPLPSSNGPCMK